MCGIHHVYVVFEFCEIDGPFMRGVYDNHEAAQACVDAGRAAGLDRWFVTPKLEDEYASEDDYVNKQEENNHG